MTEGGDEQVTLGEHQFVIPEGYDIRPVGGTEQEALEPCPHCGAAINPFRPNCESCDQPHPFLAIRQKNSLTETTTPSEPVVDVIRINKQEVRGNETAKSRIDVGDEAVVGTLSAPDIYLGYHVSSASVTGLNVTCGSETHLNYCTLQGGYFGPSSEIDTLTIAQGEGKVEFGMLSHIRTLRLDESVKFRVPLFVKIDTITRGHYSLDRMFRQTQ